MVISLLWITLINRNMCPVIPENSHKADVNYFETEEARRAFVMELAGCKTERERFEFMTKAKVTGIYRIPGKRIIGRLSFPSQYVLTIVPPDATTLNETEIETVFAGWSKINTDCLNRICADKLQCPEDHPITAGYTQKVAGGKIWDEVAFMLNFSNISDAILWPDQILRFLGRYHASKESLEGFIATDP